MQPQFNRTTKIILFALFPILILSLFFIVRQNTNPQLPTFKTVSEITDELRVQYLPATYGLPDTIAGYPVIGVINAENMECIPEAYFQLIIKLGDSDQDTFLKSDPHQKIQTEIDNLGRLDLSYVLLTNPRANLDKIIIEIYVWNQVKRMSGCNRLGGPVFSLQLMDF